MQQLLDCALKRGWAVDYVADLLAAFPTGDRAREVSESARLSPDESLTNQELSILRLMAAGLSYHEIASELYLSINTIKWYTTHIYRKLGVHRRAHGVMRAKQLGLS